MVELVNMKDKQIKTTQVSPISFTGRVLNSELKDNIGKTVVIAGWIHAVRELSGKLAFVLVRDRTGMAQVVVTDEKLVKELREVQPESVIKVTGKVADASGKTALGVELQEPKIEFVSRVTEPTPITMYKKELDANLETILDNRGVSVRHPKIQAIFKVQASILKAFQEAMDKLGFTQFRSPVLMGVPSESGADLFEVKYFDTKAYLAQSPQLYKQIMVGAFERAYTVTPVFRAEKHSTTRHILECTQLDGEMGFIDSYQDIITVVETVVRDLLGYLHKTNAADLELCGATLPKLPNGAFPQIKIKEALKLIEKRTKKSSKRAELDLDPEDEREIGKWALVEHGSDFVWLVGFKKDKNFYTWNNPDNKDESLSFDLECRGLEWLSGTHRIHDYAALSERMKTSGLSLDNYEPYLQAFKYGMPPEGGFSLGLERMTMQILGLANIREATLFPSDLTRIAGKRIKQKTVNSGEVMAKTIRELLDSRNVPYDYAEHEPVTTSEQSAKVRGTKIEEGAKAIVLVGKKTKTNYMVVLPANLRVNTKAVAEKTGEPVEMEKPDEILRKYGLEVGGVPPFGNLMSIKVFLDKKLLENDRAAFNCGLRTSSVIMSSKDLAEYCEGEIGEYSV